MKISIKLLLLFIIIGVAAAVVMNMGLLENDDPPEYIKERIELLNTSDYSIDSIKATDEKYTIKLELNEIPRTEIIEEWTETVCKEIRKILVAESIYTDISVKAYAYLMGGKTKYYGETFYDNGTHRYTFHGAD